MIETARHIFSSLQHETRIGIVNPPGSAVGQTFLSAGASDIPVRVPAVYQRKELATGQSPLPADRNVCPTVGWFLGSAAASSYRSVRPRATTAFSLIEVLIAVTLMSVIVLGLMAMFGETQRAFRTGINQVDIMEGGRSAMDLIAREVEQAVATDQSGAVNFSVRNGFFRGSTQLGIAPAGFSPYLLRQELPGTGELRTNVLQDLVFASREGQQWLGIGYAVIYTNYLGTLYRYETNFSAVLPGWENCAGIAYDSFMNNNNPEVVRYSKVLENVVHFRARTYDSLGRLLSNDWNYKSDFKGLMRLPRPLAAFGFEYITAEFYSNAIPAYVEIELGVLDPKVAGRARTLGEDSLNAQRLYLEKQAGSLQIFRRRVPIRNVDPSVYQ